MAETRGRNMNNSWKSCNNCSNMDCSWDRDEFFFQFEICKRWKPMPCKNCGGALSKIREHNGKKYRHCYSCHFEFEI